MTYPPHPWFPAECCWWGVVAAKKRRNSGPSHAPWGRPAPTGTCRGSWRSCGAVTSTMPTVKQNGNNETTTVKKATMESQPIKLQLQQLIRHPYFNYHTQTTYMRPTNVIDVCNDGDSEHRVQQCKRVVTSTLSTQHVYTTYPHTARSFHYGTGSLPTDGQSVKHAESTWKVLIVHFWQHYWNSKSHWLWLDSRWAIVQLFTGVGL